MIRCLFKGVLTGWFKTLIHTTLNFLLHESWVILIEVKKVLIRSCDLPLNLLMHCLQPLVDWHLFSPANGRRWGQFRVLLFKRQRLAVGEHLLGTLLPLALCSWECVCSSVRHRVRQKCCKYCKNISVTIHPRTTWKSTDLLSSVRFWRSTLNDCNVSRTGTILTGEHSSMLTLRPQEEIKQFCKYRPNNLVVLVSGHPCFICDVKSILAF